MLVVKNYSEFNQRRYGNPWIAQVGNNGKIDFSGKKRQYTIFGNDSCGFQGKDIGGCKA